VSLTVFKFDTDYIISLTSTKQWNISNCCVFTSLIWMTPIMCLKIICSYCYNYCQVKLI